MKIYLIQPGENDSSNLTKNGELELYSLARRFLSDKIDIHRVYVNGHDVSRQSGQILSKKLEVPVISDERFVEVNRDIILGNIKEEDFDNLDNVNLFIDELANKGKNAIITIGGGIHRLIISRLTGMPINETRHFSFLPSGVSILERSKKDGTEKWRIAVINDTNHLRIP